VFNGHLFVLALEAIAMEICFFRSSLVAVLAAVACSSGDKYPQGAERGPCYPNNTCNAGLTCYSDRCVNAGGGSGGGTQGTTAAGVMVTTLAGSAAAPPGYADGAGSTARFYSPIGIAVDGTGNVFVADQGNSVIRKITPAGVVTTFAGSAGLRESVDGAGTDARFSDPETVAVDRTGNLFVAEYMNNTIRKITPAGVVTTFAGSAGLRGSADGTGTDARFYGPMGVAVDAAGNVFVADGNNMTIRKITPAGGVTTFAGTAGPCGSGTGDGTGTAARFCGPNGIAVDGAGNVFVADSGGITIRKITPAGVVTTLAGSTSSSGIVDGTGTAASFSLTSGVVTDAAGNLFVADTGHNTIRKITPAGVVTTVAGSVEIVPAGQMGQKGSVDGTGTSAQFNEPMGLAVDGSGNIFVADTFNNTIRKITPTGK
jgi:sugar lactone lactonase YvrE